MQNPKTNKISSQSLHKQPDFLRLFYALIPDDVTNARLQECQIHVSGKKTPPENLHMTLFFLGNQPKRNLPALNRFLDRISFEPFEMKLDKIGYFPKIGLSWIGPEQTPAQLARMFEDTRQFLIPAYLKDKNENFRPHITLARRSSKAEIKMETPISWQVSRLVLIQSISSSEKGNHPEYRILHERKGFNSNGIDHSANAIRRNT